jgi:hypothetical protein
MTGKISIDLTDRKEARTANGIYPKVAVQWPNQALRIYQGLCFFDSKSLRHRHLWVYANRWQQLHNEREAEIFKIRRDNLVGEHNVIR